MGRKDGKLYACPDPIYGVLPYILRERYDAMNSITIDVPIDPLRKYINKNRNGDIKLSYLGIILSAYLRCVSQYPGLNRFIVNHRIYSRNDFSFMMVVLKPGTDKETTSKISLNLDDNVFEVNEKLNGFVDDNRVTENNNSTDKLAAFLVRHPLLTDMLVKSILFMDRHGFLPKKVMDASPFHSSLLISNVGSIRLDKIYHHVYSFGTCSISITIGKPKKKLVKVNDEIVEKTFIQLGIVMDERIATGKYFANVLETLTHLLKNPMELENKPEKIEYDPTL